MSLTLRINGVDRTSRVPADSLRVTTVLTSQPDTLAFQLRLPPGATSEIPAPTQEVTLYDGAEQLFGGIIINSPRAALSRAGAGDLLVTVTCQDYSALLTRKLIAEVFLNQTTGAIAADLVSRVPGFSVAAAADGPLVKTYPVNYASVFDALTTLAQGNGMDWWVDSAKRLHWIEAGSGVVTAAWNLTEQAGVPYTASASYADFQYGEDVTQIRNVVTVRGARTPSAVVSQKEVGNGQSRSWKVNLGKPLAGTLGMSIDGIGQLIGEEGQVDPEDYDWLVNYANASVQAAKAATPTPTAGQVIEFTYRYETQIISQARDYSSINRYGEWEHVIADENITSRDVANAVAKAQLRLYGNPGVTVRYTTTRPGLTSGVRQRVTIPRLGVNAVFLLRSVEMSLRGYSSESTTHQDAGYFKQWLVMGEKVSD